MEPQQPPAGASTTFELKKELEQQSSQETLQYQHPNRPAISVSSPMNPAPESEQSGRYIERSTSLFAQQPSTAPCSTHTGAQKNPPMFDRSNMNEEDREAVQILMRMKRVKIYAKEQSEEDIYSSTPPREWVLERDPTSVTNPVGQNYWDAFERSDSRSGLSTIPSSSTLPLTSSTITSSMDVTRPRLVLHGPKRRRALSDTNLGSNEDLSPMQRASVAGMGPRKSIRRNKTDGVEQMVDGQDTGSNALPRRKLILKGK